MKLLTTSPSPKNSNKRNSFTIRNSNGGGGGSITQTPITEKTPINGTGAVVRLDDAFFENLENVRPLRGGRKAATLNSVLVVRSGRRPSVDEAEQRFLSDWQKMLELAENEEEEEADPLETMWVFACWFEQHFPSGNQRHFFPMLYKICVEFSAWERYQNDERLMKTWFKLAENFPESGLAVMEFAFQRGSCRQLARFYLRWAEMFQFMGWWNQAREKLQLGLTMHAAPIQLIHQAMDELEAGIMRTMKAKMLAEEEEAELDAWGLNNSEPREALAKLRGLGRRHIAPVIRTPCGPPGKVVESVPISTPFGRKTAMAMNTKGKEKFTIFAEDEVEKPTLSSLSTVLTVRHQLIGDARELKHSTIAAEFVDDPDYQALFGFFQQQQQQMPPQLPVPAKRTVEYTNKENRVLPPPLVLDSSSTTATRARRRPTRIPPLRFDDDDDAEDGVENSNGDAVISPEEESVLPSSAVPSSFQRGGLATARVPAFTVFVDEEEEVRGGNGKVQKTPLKKKTTTPSPASSSKRQKQKEVQKNGGQQQIKKKRIDEKEKLNGENDGIVKKPRLMLQKRLVRECSVEEHYAQRILAAMGL